MEDRVEPFRDELERRHAERETELERAEAARELEPTPANDELVATTKARVRREEEADERRLSDREDEIEDSFVPHFVSGVLGRTFPTPFASPPFRGQSSPRVNVLYGLCNLAVAYALLLRVGNFEPRSALHAGAFGLGLTAWSLMITCSLAPPRRAGLSAWLSRAARADRCTAIAGSGGWTNVGARTQGTRIAAVPKNGCDQVEAIATNSSRIPRRRGFRRV